MEAPYKSIWLNLARRSQTQITPQIDRIQWNKHPACTSVQKEMLRASCTRALVQFPLSSMCVAASKRPGHKPELWTEAWQRRNSASNTFKFGPVASQPPDCTRQCLSSAFRKRAKRKATEKSLQYEQNLSSHSGAAIVSRFFL